MAAAQNIGATVINALMPYAVLGAVGFIGYRWLKKSGVIDGVKKTFTEASETISSTADDVGKWYGSTHTGQAQTAAENGDWIKAGQELARNIPVVNVGEKGYNWLMSKIH